MALLVATAFAALWLMFPLFTLEHSSFGVYVVTAIVTGLIVALIGAPLYLLALRTGLTTAGTAMLAGIATGIALPVLNALFESAPGRWRYLAVYALVGGASGLVFYLAATAPRLVSRQTALLLVLAGVATGAALFAGGA